MNEHNDDAGMRGEVDPIEEQIVVEIEQTRAEMSGTIEQIGHRMNPQTIADQAREQIREATVGRVERLVEDAGYTAQQTGNTVMETIRQNPVPAALAAIGIGWLALRARDSSAGNGGQRGRHAYARGGYGAYAPQYRGSRYQAGRQGGTMEGIRGTVVTGTEEVRQRAEQAGEDAQRAVDDVALRSQEAVAQAQYQLQSSMAQAQRQFDRALGENPLALGALAVGVGAAVALALPETRHERELMGEQRDAIVGQVEQAATRALGEAEKAARDTGEQLRHEASQS